MKIKVLSVIVCFMASIFVMPALAKAYDYSKITASWNGDKLVAAKDRCTDVEFTLPDATITECGGMWMVKNGSQWVPYDGRTFQNGTFRYEMQIRLEPDDLVLPTDAVLEVDGVTWTNLVNETGYSSDTYWHYYCSPEYVITGLKDVELACTYREPIPSSKVGIEIDYIDLGYYVYGNFPITFEKVSGPSWLDVSPSGVISGKPIIEAKNQEDLVIKITDLKSSINFSIPVGDSTKSAIVRKVVGASKGKVGIGEAVSNAYPEAEDVVTAYTCMAQCKKMVNGIWTVYEKPVFEEGKYRIEIQLRLQDERNILESDATFEVDGKPWISLYGVEGYGSDTSWHYYISPVIDLKGEGSKPDPGINNDPGTNKDPGNNQNQNQNNGNLNKKNQKITVAKMKKYKSSKLKKKKVSFSLKAKTTGNGKLTYKVTKGKSKCISVNKKGKVTLKKKCKKGTYKIKITASATSEYNKIEKVVTIKVK